MRRISGWLTDVHALVLSASSSSLFSSKVVAYGHFSYDFATHTDRHTVIFKMALTAARLREESLWWWQCRCTHSSRFTPTSWDLCHRQNLSGGNSGLNKANERTRLWGRWSKHSATQSHNKAHLTSVRIICMSNYTSHTKLRVVQLLD